VGDGPESLADATLRLLSSLEERRRLAGAAESLVRDRYSWERQAERLLALYEDD
jgi:glycosyltransferase involved in cell wall biosynthesis